VTQLAHIDVAALERAPLPGGSVKSVTRVIVTQPLTTVVRRLLVSSTRLAAGKKVDVVAGSLPSTLAHDALFVLQGPGYWGQRLVQAKDGIAGGIITLPRTMKSGTWAIGVEDLSEVTAGPGDSVQGQVLLDLGIFKVG
jgi:hypothetical protein